MIKNLFVVLSKARLDTGAHDPRKAEQDLFKLLSSQTNYIKKIERNNSEDKVLAWLARRALHVRHDYTRILEFF